MMSWCGSKILGPHPTGRMTRGAECGPETPRFSKVGGGIWRGRPESEMGHLLYSSALGQLGEGNFQSFLSRATECNEQLQKQEGK